MQVSESAASYYSNDVREKRPCVFYLNGAFHNIVSKQLYRKSMISFQSSFTEKA